MRWITEVRVRLGQWLGRSAAEARMAEEFRFHLEMETEKNLREGMSREEARRRAVLAFGGVEGHKEAMRESRGLPWLEVLGQDLRYALRSLRASPGYAAAAVLTLALGIGATTGIFAAVHAVLLAPLPYPDGERLVRVLIQNSPTNLWGPSAVDFLAVGERQRSFTAVGAVRPGEVGVVLGSEPERVSHAAATAGFFEALGVRLDAGRAVSARDERVGAPGVAVVGPRLAARLGGPTAALGREVTVDGVSHSVVGVLPAGAEHLAGVRAELWTALQIPPPERRGPFGLFVVGRLAPGSTIEAARRDLAAISEHIFPEWSASFQDRTATLTAVPLRESMVRRSGRTLWMFAAAVGLVLLIALTNVAGLVLVRATGRAREWALRNALGASRRRLARQLVTESVVLTTLGALAGLLLASATLRVLLTIGPRMPRLEEARLDPLAFAFAAGLALLTGLVVGAYPTLSVLRDDPANELRGGARQVGVGRRAGTVRGLLVAAEFALALPLLTGAALLLGSFLRLQRVDPGFDPRPVLTLAVSLPGARYPEGADVAGYWARALPRVREVPGVLAAAVSTEVPPEEASNTNNFDLLDRPVPAGSAQPAVPWASVTADFFHALGVPLLEGRTFTPADTAGAPPVVVVSRAWERRYSPERSAVGRQLVSGGCIECPPTTVVGVVGDVKYGGLSGGGEAVYEPLAQGSGRDATLFVRAAGPPAGLLPAVRRALHSLDPGIPLDEAGPLEARVYATVAQPRHWATLVGVFAAVALVLAAVGIFGMLSYLVATRRREIGVRVALGAGRGEVVALVVRRGMGYAVTGAVAGVVAALPTARALEAVLYGISPHDPGTLGAVTALLLVVALGACWLPARRAAAIDPMEVMRTDG